MVLTSCPFKLGSGLHWTNPGIRVPIFSLSLPSSTSFWFYHFRPRDRWTNPRDPNRQPSNGSPNNNVPDHNFPDNGSLEDGSLGNMKDKEVVAVIEHHPSGAGATGSVPLTAENNNDPKLTPTPPGGETENHAAERLNGLPGLPEYSEGEQY